MIRAAALAALLIACRSDSPPSPAETRQATIAVPTRTIEPQLPRQDPVLLVERGAEPRAPLRYAIPSGARQQLQLETHAKGRQLVAGASPVMTELPVMTTAFEITAGDNGALTVAAQRGPTEGAWALLAGRTFRLTGYDQARFGGLSFADPGPSGRAILDEVGQRLLALSIPVPSEPVGVGATWRVITLLRQRPALVKQTATYTLVARDASHWTIGVELARVAEPQTAEDPGLPEGTSIDVVALVMRARGQLQVDPLRAFPTGDLATSSTLHVKLRSAGGAAEQIFEDESSIQIRAAM